jgi:hypothetical protein
MKKSLKMLLLALGLATAVTNLSACGDANKQNENASSQTPITQAQIASARQTVQVFGGELKKALLAGLGEGGPEQALTVCRDMAPEIATRTATQTGWQVGRSSLKPRNGQHVPDSWEKQVLENFAAAQARGEDPGSLEFHEVVTVDGQQVLRYMKAIPTGKLCLRCHGRDIDPATAAKIAELYPEDQATGFAEGDIRGAFTLRRAL